MPRECRRFRLLPVLATPGGSSSSAGCGQATPDARVAAPAMNATRASRPAAPSSGCRNRHASPRRARSRPRRLAHRLIDRPRPLASATAQPPPSLGVDPFCPPPPRRLSPGLCPEPPRRAVDGLGGTADKRVGIEPGPLSFVPGGEPATWEAQQRAEQACPVKVGEPTKDQPGYDRLLSPSREL
jgi:hypothetical protein